MPADGRDPATMQVSNVHIGLVTFSPCALRMVITRGQAQQSLQNICKQSNGSAPYSWEQTDRQNVLLARKSVVTCVIHIG
jgi:hypothetical protein